MSWARFAVEIIEKGKKYVFYVFLFCLVLLFTPNIIIEYFGAKEIYNNIRGYLFFGGIAALVVLLVELAIIIHSWIKDYRNPIEIILKMAPDQQAELFALHSIGKQEFILPNYSQLNPRSTKKAIIINLGYYIRVGGKKTNGIKYKISDEYWKVLENYMSYLVSNSGTNYSRIAEIKDALNKVSRQIRNIDD